MESVGAFPCGEWDSLVAPQFLDQSSFPLEHDEGIPNPLATSSFSSILESNTSIVGVNESLFCSLNSFSCDPSDSISTPNIPSYYLAGSNQSPASNNASMGITGFNEIVYPYATTCTDLGMEETGCFYGGMSNGQAANFAAADALALAKAMLLKRKFDIPDFHHGHIDINGPSENAKKRLRVSRDAGSDCSYSSEDDNGSERKGYAAIYKNGKTRANRGAATDPQSLYARKRRERINERLRILQSLVPNGTKVDISTMLEEAVHYVKFLQLQIKLLSSDELWMFAPLAYNGVDISLHQKIFSELLRH